MKNLIENESLKNAISFENGNISVKKEILENVSIGIFGEKNQKNLRLKKILQSFGFFVRIIENLQEALFAAEDNLIQMLLISVDLRVILSESNKDEFFKFCKTLRKKFTFFDFPILLLNKNSSTIGDFSEKIFELEINDFLCEPLELSTLLAKIQILFAYKNLHRENQELLKSEREKSVLLYSVTHNVNIPLTILLNEIQNLYDENSENKSKISEKKSDSLKNIFESAREINLIIQNALNSYKISDGRYVVNKKILNLQEILESENSFLLKKLEAKNQTFEFLCDEKNPQVFCDENSLKGIYANLLDNAIKYSEIGGKIKVKISSDEKFLLLSVIDEGRGIPKEKRSHLFERFAQIGTKTTAQEKSCGLGLYVVNEICKLNDISLEYSENTNAKSGSIFTAKFTKIG